MEHFKPHSCDLSDDDLHASDVLLTSVVDISILVVIRERVDVWAKVSQEDTRRIGLVISGSRVSQAAAGGLAAHGGIHEPDVFWWAVSFELLLGDLARTAAVAKRI